MEAHEALEKFEAVEEHAHGTGLTRLAALTVAIVAAFLAVSTFLGNEAAQDGVQGQTKAANAETVANIFDTQDLIFQSDQALLLVFGNSGDKSLAATAAAGTKSLDSIAKKVPAERKELARKTDEARSDVAHANDQHRLYEIAEVLLQIAIVLASVAIIATRRFLLHGGQAVAVAGAVVLVIGYLA